VIKLLIVDDHPVVRDGLRGMLGGDPEFTVVGEAANGAEAVTLTENLGPDVVLMDLRMPGTDGVAAINKLRERGLSARVLALTTYDTDSDVLPAIEAGATGYLLKDAPREELFRAVRAAARGEAVLSPSVATRLLGQLHLPALREGRLPGVVEYLGYGGGRGLAHEKTLFAQAGYAHLIMDTRGQGSGWSAGDTPDPAAEGGGPAHPGYMRAGRASTTRSSSAGSPRRCLN
jgi:DNA-binding NarL/FixJ family response regulator